MLKPEVLSVLWLVYEHCKFYIYCSEEETKRVCGEEQDPAPESVWVHVGEASGVSGRRIVGWLLPGLCVGTTAAS